MKFIITILTVFCFVALIFSSCGSKSSNKNLQTEKPVIDIVKNSPGYGKSYSGNKQNSNKVQQTIISKVTFFIENSGSMKGYVTGSTKYVDVLTDLTNHPDFIKQNVIRNFYFNSGASIPHKITNLQNNLVPANFNQAKSNLNQLFKTALDSNGKSTVTVLISDGIYDMCPEPTPLNKLTILSHALRSVFINKLQNTNFQTIVVKLKSDFSGRYFPGNCCNASNINQERPYYLWVFGETEILKKYFSDEYLKNLNGYVNSARYFKFNLEKDIYKPNSYKKIGTYNPSTNDKYSLENVKTNSAGVFQFSIAVNFSKLPLNDNYLTDKSNYICTNGFVIVSIDAPTNVTKLGLPNQTHLIVVKKTGNPIGQLTVSLLNKGYDWISDTNLNNDCNINGNTTQTFGFEVLNQGIIEAYQNFNDGKVIAKFNINLRN